MARRKYGDRGLKGLVNSEKKSHRIAGGNVIIDRTGARGKIIGRDGGLYQIEITGPGKFKGYDYWLEKSSFRKA